MRVRQGFTLVEVMVAAVIIGFAAVAALGAFGADLRTADLARRKLEAAALAEQRLALLQVAPATALDGLPDSIATGHFAPPFADYRWSSMAKRSTLAPDLVDLTVRVDWDAGTFELATRVSREPMVVPQ